jgi:hypothetical protein
MIHFTPLRQFHSDDTRSTYVPGLHYTARPADTKLNEVLPAWVKDGLVQIVVPGASIAGRGTVR